MAKVLVFLETTDGNLKKSSLEILSLLQNSGHEITALSTSPLSSEGEAQCASYGTQTLMVSKVENYHPDVVTQLSSEALAKSGAEWIFASTSPVAKDVFPRVAAKVDGAFVSDITEVEPADGGFVLRRPMYSGKCSAAVNFSGGGVRVVLLRPNQLPVRSGESSGGAMDKVELEAPAPSSGLKLKEVIQGSSQRADLTEADRIISGGRGLKEASNFSLLEEVADVLGATVGASRAVVDAGWVDHSMQVGQTGKTVAPSLYIACGISGAVQHLAGMSSSKVIVAVNSDANAPIFQKATYGIVADALEFLPVFRDQLKAFL